MLSVYATKHLLPWLRDYLRDGGYMPTDEEALRVTYAPKVVAMQDKHIRSRIFKERDNGIVVVVDETSDVVDNNEPVDVLIVTSEAVYHVDTVLLPEDRDDEEK